MFETHSAEIDGLAGACALEACWAQWVALGSPATPSGEASAEAIIDPEALVLMSLRIATRERRLHDLVGWWARVGSWLMSVQRCQSVAARFPGERTRAGLGRFARLATDAGDRRWARHVTEPDGVAPVRVKGPAEASLDRDAALWLRLRAGLGVGAKADTLAFLVGAAGTRATVRTIEAATGYSSVAVRGAAREMALARFLHESAGRPARYSVRAEAWGPVLGFSGPEAIPRWRHWSELFAFLDGALDWAESAVSADAPGSRVLASRARDVMEDYAGAFDRDRIEVPRPDGHPGLAAADGLVETTRIVAGWILANL